LGVDDTITICKNWLCQRLLPVPVKTWGELISQILELMGIRVEPADGSTHGTYIEIEICEEWIIRIEIVRIKFGKVELFTRNSYHKIPILIKNTTRLSRTCSTRTAKARYAVCS
jgi:hypothetical protein